GRYAHQENTTKKHQENPMEAEVRNTGGRSVWSVRPTVLLVDNEPTILDSLGRYLAGSGYRLLTADNADRALKCLCQSVDVEAVILDVRLSGNRSGLEILEFLRLHQDWRDIPVLILTGVCLTPEEEAIIQRYPAYLFYKPEGYGELVQYLNRLLHLV